MKLSKQTVAMMREWNLANYGRGISDEGEIKDPETLARLEQLRWPGESMDGVVQRLIRQGGGGQVN